MRRETEHGMVVGIRGGFAQIRVTPSSECNACALKRRCHTGEDGPVLHWPANGLEVGQEVTIRTTSAPRLLGAGLVYLVPLVAMLLGAAVGNLHSGDPGALVGCGVGLAAGAFVVVLVGRIGTRRGWWRLAVEPFSPPKSADLTP